MPTRGPAALVAAACALLAALVPPAAFAQSRADKVYTIANYPVDATADNAVAAKDRALADGQQAALRSLLKRILPVTAYGQLKQLRSAKAGDLIEGFAIRSERNSSTQYIANLDFTFSPQAVRALLREKGIPYLDQQASQTVVVPLVRGAQGIEKATPTARLWLEAWSGIDLENALTPVRLGEPKSTPNADVIKRLVGGDSGALSSLAAEFRSDYTVLALAEPDPPAKRLHVWLAGSDASGPILLKRSYRLGSDLAYSLELAAVVGLGVMEGRWKAASGITGGNAAAATAEAFEVVVEFRSRGQWEEMRSRIERLRGVEDVDVVSLTTRNATLALRYPGGPSQLAGAVEAQGMMMQQGDGGWVLRPMP